MQVPQVAWGRSPDDLADLIEQLPVRHLACASVCLGGVILGGMSDSGSFDGSKVGRKVPNQTEGGFCLVWYSPCFWVVPLA
ncbi:hypothetical protein GCM10009678_01130 [Actinomadura kijaniata]